jgi:hypothetical protein
MAKVRDAMSHVIDNQTLAEMTATTRRKVQAKSATALTGRLRNTNGRNALKLGLRRVS